MSVRIHCMWGRENLNVGERDDAQGISRLGHRSIFNHLDPFLVVCVFNITYVTSLYSSTELWEKDAENLYFFANAPSLRVTAASLVEYSESTLNLQALSRIREKSGIENDLGSPLHHLVPLGMRCAVLTSLLLFLWNWQGSPLSILQSEEKKWNALFFLIRCHQRSQVFRVWASHQCHQLHRLLDNIA